MANEDKYQLKYSGQKIDSLLDKIETAEKVFQKILTAGDHITIDSNNRISATSSGGSDLDLSGNSTVTVGGITAGTDLSQYDHDLNGLLQQMLAPTKWSFDRFTCSASAGIYEYGATIDVTAVTIERTNSRGGDINIKVGTESGSSNLYDGQITPSTTSFNLTSSKSYTGSDTGTIYCTISNGIDEDLTKTAVFTREYYTYYKVTNTSSAPGSTGWIPVGSNSIQDIEITAAAGQYIWIASTQNKTNIYEWNDLSGGYNTDPTPTTKTSNQTLYTTTGQNVHFYYFYRTTNPRTGATNKKFKLG